MTEPIALAIDRTDLTVVHHGLETARRLMPGTARWALRAAGQGPWNELYGMSTFDVMAIRTPGGSMRYTPACNIDISMMAGARPDAWIGHLFSAFSQIAAGHFNLCEVDFVMLMRPNSVALAWRNDDGAFEGRYVASPLASGHEILEDQVDLAANFSKLFRIVS